jgi:hypothetical protein
MAYVVECLPKQAQEALSSNPSTPPWQKKKKRMAWLYVFH